MADELTEELLLDIENAVALGAKTNAEIANTLGWSLGKFSDWKNGRRKDGANESNQIQSAIKRGKSRQRAVFLAKAENALLKKIEGYSVTETTEEEVTNKSGDIVKATTKTVTKHFQPDTTAIIFALVNSGEWHNTGFSNDEEEQPSEIIIGLSEENKDVE